MRNRNNTVVVGQGLQRLILKTPRRRKDSDNVPICVLLHVTLYLALVVIEIQRQREGIRKIETETDREADRYWQRERDQGKARRYDERRSVKQRKGSDSNTSEVIKKTHIVLYIKVTYGIHFNLSRKLKMFYLSKFHSLVYRHLIWNIK